VLDSFMAGLLSDERRTWAFLAFMIGGRKGTRDQRMLNHRLGGFRFKDALEAEST
jgi:hypothetical protein